MLLSYESLNYFIGLNFIYFFFILVHFGLLKIIKNKFFHTIYCKFPIVTKLQDPSKITFINRFYMTLIEKTK